MKVMFYNTELNNSLKADVYVYGIVLELAFLLFMVPALGFIMGLMLSFSSSLQYGSMGISFVIFLVLWRLIHTGKEALTLDKIIVKLIYQQSIKYIKAEAYSLLKEGETKDGQTR